MRFRKQVRGADVSEYSASNTGQEAERSVAGHRQ